MLLDILESLDFGLAWKRVTRDILRDRVFIKHPIEIQLIEQDFGGWIENLHERLVGRDGAPQEKLPPQLGHKTTVHTLPGFHLAILTGNREYEDRVVRIVGLCFETDRLANSPVEWGKPDKCVKRNSTTQHLQCNVLGMKRARRQFFLILEVAIKERAHACLRFGSEREGKLELHCVVHGLGKLNGPFQLGYG